MLKPVKAASEGGATLSVLGDGSVRASGKNPGEGCLHADDRSGREARPLTALRLEVMPDGSLPSLGPGRASNGNFVLSEIEAATDGRRRRLVERLGDPLARRVLPPPRAIDGKPDTGWAILAREWAGPTSPSSRPATTSAPAARSARTATSP